MSPGFDQRLERAGGCGWFSPGSCDRQDRCSAPRPDDGRRLRRLPLPRHLCPRGGSALAVDDKVTCDPLVLRRRLRLWQQRPTGAGAPVLRWHGHDLAVWEQCHLRGFQLSPRGLWLSRRYHDGTTGPAQCRALGSTSRAAMDTRSHRSCRR